MKKHFLKIEVLLIAVLWLGLTVFSWLKPADAFSISERRPLEQAPEVTLENIGNGNFMKDFEDYTLDQFPLRDTFRRIKALAAFNLFFQKDNNDIYIHNGQAASLEYPLNETSLAYAKNRIDHIMKTYFSDSDAEFFFSMIPDKGYYLAEAGGYPAMDYVALEEACKDIFSFGEYIDITASLTAEDYYATDSHWKQENLQDTVAVIAEALGITQDIWTEYETVTAEKPFYGVYYGQAALPLEPDALRYLRNDLLDACTVYNAERNQTTGIYDLEKLTGKDPYEVFLSGATPILRLENPNAATEDDLVVFRDSYASSLVPLLAGGYRSITLVDTRYIAPDFLGQYVDFSEAEQVLFLYSTTILNNSRALR